MKMNILRKTALLVALVVGFCMIAKAQNQTFTYQNLEYEVFAEPVGNQNGYAKLLGHKNGTNASGNLNIPEVAYWVSAGKAYDVKWIADDAFRGCTRLRGSLTIPNSINDIGNYAFYGCTGFDGTLSLGDVTRIKDCAFANCSHFTGELVIPNTVTTIGVSAFQGCSGFTGLTLPNSLTEISAKAFADCSGFTGSLTIPNTVTTIGQMAFCQCSGFTGTLTIPNAVTTIGYMAFGHCTGFTGTLTLPNSIAEIGAGAFMLCLGFTGTLTIPNTVEVISHDAFSGCAGFTGLNIPNSVTDIQDFAFYGCSGLVGNLTIPNSVVNIKSKAFKNCANLSGSLIIGSSVVSIDDEAFKNCGFTGEVKIQALTPPQLVDGGNSQFGGVPTTTLNVIFPSGAAYTASDWHNHFTNIVEGRTLVIDDLVYDVKANNKFEVVSHVNGSSAMGGVTIPSMVVWFGVSYDVTSIGDNCMKDSNISEITIPSSITSIGANAFKNCQNLTNNQVMVQATNPPTLGSNAFANIPSTVLLVPSTAVSAYQSSPWHSIFNNITGYTAEFTSGNLNYRIIDGQSVSVIGHASGSSATGSLNIPSTVTNGGTTYTVREIASNAFHEQTGLTGSLTIPNTVEVIGYGAFDGCSNLSGTLTIPGSVKIIYGNAFAYCHGLTGSLTIPNSVTFIGQGAFSNCYGFNGTLTLSNSLTEICYQTFYECYGLTGDINIPNSVAKIGTMAFMCYNNTASYNGTLTIPESVRNIETWAFYNCANISEVYSLPTVPPTITNDAFEGLGCTTLHVQFGCGEAYTATNWHNHFTNIVANECIDDGEYRYKILSGDNVYVYQHNQGTSASGYKIIPESVSFNGVTYNVASIGDDVFKGSDISGVTIPATIESIGANAISDCPNLVVVNMKPETPPTLGSNAFGNIPCYSLMVPCGCSEAYETAPWSDLFIYFTEECDDVEDVADEDILSVYPNPAHGTVKIEAENIRNISVFNTMGQQVFDGKVSGDEFEYDFRGVSGMFIIRVETDNGVATKRVVVM